MIEYIGIDIGGTNIRIGAIDEEENIIFQYIEPTFKEVVTTEDLYMKIKRFIKGVPNYQQVKAIGIGAPGIIDPKLGQIITSRNVSILNKFPLVEKLNKDFNKPIFLENDARVATFAEAIKGRGQDKNIVCYITISTGLGGGIVIDKKIYKGSNNFGVYFSRILLDGENTSNDLISGTALLNQAKEKISDDIKETCELFELKEKGNEIAIEVIETFKRNLTVLLLNISSIINPDIIILGGGVLKSKDKFLVDVIKEFELKAHPFAKNTIIDTAFFEEPGIIGAALLAKSKMGEKNEV